MSGNKKILVTGGTGFLGHHLLRELVKENIPVRAIHRSNSDRVVMDAIEGVEWMEADVLDIVKLEEAFEGITHVYHSAAMVSFVPSDFKKMHQINIEGTKNVVNLSLEKGVEKLVHVSSIAAVSRKANQEILTEGDASESEGLPSEYGKSKYKSEMEVWRGFAEGLKVAIVNPSIIVGPFQWDRSSVRLFDREGFIGKVYTNGITGFVSVHDVVNAMQLLMNSEVNGERFILSAENLPLKQVFNWMAEDLGIKAPTIGSPKMLSAIMWRAFYLLHKIGGPSPLITKETAKSAHAENKYSGNKFATAFDYEYQSIREIVRETCRVKKSGERPF